MMMFAQLAKGLAHRNPVPTIPGHMSPFRLFHHQSTVFVVDDGVVDPRSVTPKIVWPTKIFVRIGIVWFSGVDDDYGIDEFVAVTVMVGGFCPR